MPGRSRGVALCAFALVVLARADFTQYLLVSQPALAKVVFFKIPQGPPAPSFKLKPKDLITDLQEPSGLAFDQKNGKLYVADLGGKKIVAYSLSISEGKLVVTDTETAASSVAARWVAVDGVGNVFYTVGPENMVQKLYAERLALGDNEPETLYEGQVVKEVSSPSGIAVDNFHIYWANKAVGTQVGSLVRGFEVPPAKNPAASVQPLASNTLKAYGVCLGATNIFYTGAEQYVYGIGQGGGPITTITDKLLLPRGCVWDNDGTIYVADKGANAIFSFAGGQMHDLQALRITKAFNIEAPLGVAVMTVPGLAASSRRLSAVAAALGLLLTLSTGWW